VLKEEKILLSLFSFLQPKELVIFSQINKSMYERVDGMFGIGSKVVALWKAGEEVKKMSDKKEGNQSKNQETPQINNTTNSTASNVLGLASMILKPLTNPASLLTPSSSLTPNKKDGISQDPTSKDGQSTTPQTNPPLTSQPNNNNNNQSSTMNNSWISSMFYSSQTSSTTIPNLPPPSNLTNGESSKKLNHPKSQSTTTSSSASILPSNVVESLASKLSHNEMKAILRMGEKVRELQERCDSQQVEREDMTAQLEVKNKQLHFLSSFIFYSLVGS